MQEIPPNQIPNNKKVVNSFQTSISSYLSLPAPQAVSWMSPFQAAELIIAVIILFCAAHGLTWTRRPRQKRHFLVKRTKQQVF